MIKRIGDVTFEEFNKICKKNRKCSHCPLYVLCRLFPESFDFDFNLAVEVDLGGDL